MRKKSRAQSFFRGHVLKEHYAFLDIRYFPWVTRIFSETTSQLSVMWDKLKFGNAWSGNNAWSASKIHDELRAVTELFPEFGACRDRKFHCFIRSLTTLGNVSFMSLCLDRTQANSGVVVLLLSDISQLTCLTYMCFFYVVIGECEICH